MRARSIQVYTYIIYTNVILAQVELSLQQSAQLTVEERADVILSMTPELGVTNTLDALSEIASLLGEVSTV